MKEEKQKKWDLYNELKEKEADLTRDREEKLKETENRVKQAKKTLTELVQNARVVSFHLTLYNLSFCSF
jgi:hypothetical protein